MKDREPITQGPSGRMYSYPDYNASIRKPATPTPPEAPETPVAPEALPVTPPS